MNSVLIQIASCLDDNYSAYPIVANTINLHLFYQNILKQKLRRNMNFQTSNIKITKYRVYSAYSETTLV